MDIVQVSDIGIANGWILLSGDNPGFNVDIVGISFTYSGKRKSSC